MGNDALRAEFVSHAQGNMEKLRLGSILRDWNRVLDQMTSDGEAGVE